MNLLKSRKFIQVVLALVVAGAYLVNQRLQEEPTFERPGEFSLSQAISNQQSDVQVSGVANVIKVLPDDTRGSRHQRFLIKLDSGEVILIAHNIDLASRVHDLTEGDEIGFSGEFEWNDKGGVIHWTHKDPRSKHVHGYLQHDGKKYW